MVKTDYSYQTKRISHRLLKKVISREIQEPENAIVVCFPGKYYREIIEVYDLLGFKRKNIIGIEKEKEVYDYLNSQNLGIQLHFGDAYDFFKKNPSLKFGVVSLDYTSLPSRESFRTIRELFKTGNFTSHAVLHTNYYAKRINVFTKMGLPCVIDFEIVDDFKKSPRKENSARIFWQDYDNNREEFKKRDGLDLSLKDFRSDALTSFIIACSERSDTILEDIVYAESDKEIQERIKSEVNTTEVTTIEPIMPVVPELCTCKKCRKQFYDFKITAHEFACIYSLTLWNQKLEYSIKNLTRFEYVSDDNSLMFSDILTIDDNSDLVNQARSCVKGLSPKGNLIMKGGWNEYLRNKRRFEEIAREYVKRLDKKKELMCSKTMPPRIDITPRGTLDRDTALKLLNSGWTYEMFEDKFKDITPARIAAYKAHKTMGTYEEKENLDINKSKRPKKEEETKTRIFHRRVLAFDSNPDRLKKNISKIDFGGNSLDSVSVLRGIPENPGILNREKKYGLYILNTRDDLSTEAFEDLALKFCESNLYLNLLLIGNSNHLQETITTARNLGAKVNVFCYETVNGYLDKPLTLEKMLEEV